MHAPEGKGGGIDTPSQRRPGYNKPTTIQHY
jgi:hypothetical protein